MTAKIHIDTIRAAALALRDLPKQAPPPPKELGKMQALQELRAEVRALRARGYSFELIADHLQKVGIDVSASAVKKSQSAPAKKQNINRPIIESNSHKDTHSEGLDQASQAAQSGAVEATQVACAPSPFAQIENTNGGIYVGN